MLQDFILFNSNIVASFFISFCFIPPLHPIIMNYYITSLQRDFEIHYDDMLLQENKQGQII